MNYVVTLDDLIEIEKIYYYDNNEEEQLIGLTGDPHYEVANNTITVISTNEIPIPRIDYKSSKTGINLGTVGAVDINSVTDGEGNNLEYTVNDDNTLTVSNLNVNDSVRVNYDLERIRIGALEYQDNDKSKNPTKYGMRIRNSQGEDVLTTDDNGDITMTGTIHAYAGDFTGTVNAQAGEFSGSVRVGSDNQYVALTTELEDGPAIASSDYIKDRNTGWAIVGNGDAYFHNITARGCIRTAVFEYEEINAVGGAFLFRPSSTIRNALLDDDDIIITVEKDNSFNNGDWVKIAGAGSTAASLLGGIYQIEKVYDIYYGDESNETSGSSEVLVPCTYRLLGAAADFSPYIPEQDGERVSALEGGAFISLCGEPDESSEFYDNYGIGINSGQGQLFMPERAISLFETSVDDSGSSPEVSMAYTGILGTLPELEFFQTGVDESSQPTYSVDADIYSNMEKTQGIYTNNMYIGDANQYVAFYEESNEKVLDIAAGSISVGMGDYDPLYLIGDQYGVALYKGEKVDSTQDIEGNNLFINDNSLQLRNGQESYFHVNYIGDDVIEDNIPIRDGVITSNARPTTSDPLIIDMIGDQIEDGEEFKIDFTYRDIYTINSIAEQRLKKMTCDKDYTSSDLQASLIFNSLDSDRYAVFEIKGLLNFQKGIPKNIYTKKAKMVYQLSNRIYYITLDFDVINYDGNKTFTITVNSTIDIGTSPAIAHLGNGNWIVENLYKNKTILAPSLVSGNTPTLYPSQDRGIFSSSLGLGLFSAGKSQTVVGKYNTIDTTGQYAFLVGNGKSNGIRANAFGIDWNGDILTASGAKIEWGIDQGYNSCYINFKDELFRAVDVSSKADKGYITNFSISEDGKNLQLIKTNENFDSAVSEIVWNVDMSKVANLFSKSSTYVTWSNKAAGSSVGALVTLATFNLPANSIYLILMKNGNAKGGAVSCNVQGYLSQGTAAVELDGAARSLDTGGNVAIGYYYIRTTTACTVIVRTYTYDTSVTNFNGNAIAIPIV